MPAALAESSGMTATGNVRAILRRSGFRRLLAVRLTSQLGDGWFQAGLAGSVFFNPEKAADALAIATAFAVLLLPYSLVGPYAGVFLDRWSRRNVLMIANASRALLVVPGALMIWHRNEGLGFVLMALAVIAINRFFLSGLSAAQPHVVDAPRLVTANALATTLGTCVFALGLGTAAVVSRVIGTGFHQYALVSSAAIVAYGLSAVLAMLCFGAAALGPDDTERGRGAITSAVAETAQGMVAGIRHLVGHRGAALLVYAQAAHRMLYGVLALMVLLLYRNYFVAGPKFTSSLTGLGQIAVAGACGTLLASAITPPLARRIGGWRWVTALLFGLAVLIPALGAWFIKPLLLAAVLFIAIGSQGIKIVTDTALQLESADDFRGRVFSVNDTAYNLSFVGGLFLGVWVLPENGHSSAALITVGVAYAVVAASYSRLAGRNAARVGDDIQIQRRR
jgi:MFS family permease